MVHTPLRHKQLQKLIIQPGESFRISYTTPKPPITLTAQSQTITHQPTAFPPSLPSTSTPPRKPHPKPPTPAIETHTTLPTHTPIPKLNHLMAPIHLPPTRPISKIKVNLEHDDDDDGDDANHGQYHQEDATGAIFGGCAVIGVVGARDFEEHCGGAGRAWR